MKMEKYEQNDKRVIVITDGEYRLKYMFDPQRDDPAEGATLTGIFNEDGRLRPSSYGNKIDKWQPVASSKLITEW